MTKKELLARIERTPAAVEAIYHVIRFRISLPDDPDPKGGIWISLDPDHQYMIKGDADAFARIDGREVQLTQDDAKRMARVVALAMHLRAVKPISRRSGRHAPRP